MSLCGLFVLTFAFNQAIRIKGASVSCAGEGDAEKLAHQDCDELLAAKLVLFLSTVIVLTEDRLLADHAEDCLAKQQTNGGTTLLAEFQFASVRAAFSDAKVEAGVAQEHFIGSEVGQGTRFSQYPAQQECAKHLRICLRNRLAAIPECLVVGGDLCAEFFTPLIRALVILPDVA